MTERSRRKLRRSSDGFGVNRSEISRTGDGLKISIDERGAPIPKRVKGTVTVHPEALGRRIFAIDRAGTHHWRPIAPSVPIEVEMEEPALKWRGTGYLDMNWGSRPLESTFDHWDWMRADLGDGRAAIFYETAELEEEGRRLALLCDADGRMEIIEPTERHALDRTLWRVPRSGWSDGEPPAVTRTLEDTPFYVRTELEADLFGEQRTAIQESLSLRRFRSTVVKLMLPFRMPRLP
ncbi:MAG: hydratase [Pseudomonadota bacterium]